MKIDWKRKLTSRKLWVALAGFISGIIILVCHNESVAEAIGALVLSAASVVAYIVGEGLTDASYNEANGVQKVEHTTNNTNTNTNVQFYSDVDGNEYLDADMLGEIAASAKRHTDTLATTPKTTGRDGITIDGNEDEV